MQLCAVFSQQPEELFPVKGRQIPDGAHAELLKGLGGGPAHIQKVGHGKGPDQLTKVFPVMTVVASGFL